MVSSTAISKILAQLSGVPKSKVDSIALELRKYGFIQTKGPGRGGIDMDFKEARDLVVALLGADVPKAAPEAVIKINGLVDSDGNTFGDFFLKTFSEQHAKAFYVTVNRTAPMAWITFYKETDETCQTGIAEEWDHVFRDPNSNGDDPGLTLHARLFAGAINTVFQVIRASKMIEGAKNF